MWRRVDFFARILVKLIDPSINSGTRINATPRSSSLLDRGALTGGGLVNCRLQTARNRPFVQSAVLTSTHYRRAFGTKYSGVCERAAGTEYERIEGSYEYVRVVRVS